MIITLWLHITKLLHQFSEACWLLSSARRPEPCTLVTCNITSTVAQKLFKELTFYVSKSTFDAQKFKNFLFSDYTRSNDNKRT